MYDSTAEGSIQDSNQNHKLWSFWFKIILEQEALLSFFQYCSKSVNIRRQILPDQGSINDAHNDSKTDFSAEGMVTVSSRLSLLPIRAASATSKL